MRSNLKTIALALVATLLLTFVAVTNGAILTPFSDTFAGGVSGTVTRNQILKVAGDSKVADSIINDDGTTATVAASKTLAITTADKLTIGGVIAPQEIEISFHGQAAAAMVDQSFFVATQAYQVTKVRFAHAVAEATAGSLLVQVVKDTSTNAPGAGTDLLTNNTNTGFNCKSTANTVQTGTLTATGADLQLAAGDRLSVDFSASATELVGVTITVTLKRI